MSVPTVTSLNALPADQVGQAFTTLTQLVQEQLPDVLVVRGIVHDLVLAVASELAVVNQQNLVSLQQVQNLGALAQNPDADPALVDAKLSDYFITRQPGATATGSITLIVSANSTVTIPAGLQFSTPTATFATATAFTGRPIGTVLTAPTDRLLTARGDGTYSFLVDVVATTVGPAGNIRSGTQLTPSAQPANFLSAYASNDFTGGYAAETNTQLLARLPAGIAAHSCGGVDSYIGLIQSQPEFARALAFSVLGMGDPEMQRDQHWIFPVSGGGRVDIYARTQGLPVATTLQMTASLVSRDAASNGIWQFSVPKDIAPGFYDITRIAPLTAAPADTGYAILSDLRGFDLTDNVPVPDVVSVLEAAYTRYQTAVIQFVQPNTATTIAIGAQQAFLVTFRSMPQIADLQTYLSGDTVRNKMADVLVKAPVPCFLSLSFQIRVEAGDPGPDLGAIASDVADKVNTLGFLGQLHASVIYGAIAPHLTGHQAVSALDMFGQIRTPDGQTLYVRDPILLTLPNRPAQLTTGRTTTFLLDPSDIAITVVTAGYTS